MRSMGLAAGGPKAARAMDQRRRGPGGMRVNGAKLTLGRLINAVLARAE